MWLLGKHRESSCDLTVLSGAIVEIRSLEKASSYCDIAKLV